MSCQQAETLIDAYFDGELGVTESLEIESHLDRCAHCSALLERNRVLRRSLQQPGIYYEAPPALKRAIRAQPRVSIPWRVLAIAASLAAVVLLGAWMVRIFQRPSRLEALSREVVAGHIRSLQANHLFDVASTDQHTVKPWFSGKLDFAPVVKDLGAAGFPLVGGRLDYLADRPVAALLYKRRQHVISLFEWPAQSTDSQTVIRGYNVLHWSAGGLTFWAVSDVNADDLKEFVRELRK
ncbi:MAG TPA: anti-sigma factor [Bryobacteraceae bacterium]